MKSSAAAAPRRSYRQTTRAQAAEATGERILDAFARRLTGSWFDEIRLEDVAHEAGVSVQTIVRRFGGKEGLLDATYERLGRQIRIRRETAPGRVGEAIAALIEDYEVTGDLTIRSLAQEDRYPAMRRMTEIGRRSHREWVARVFAPQLAQLPPEERTRRLDALVVATDAYTWKLIRRDVRRPLADLRDLMERLVRAALADALVHRNTLEDRS